MTTYKNLFIFPALAAVALGLFVLACNDSSFSGSNATKSPAATPATTSGVQSPTTDNLGTAVPAATPVAATPAATPSTLPTPPATAVTQGSFTVWAAPNPPAAFQDYQIFIKVTLPSAATNYDKSDLSGNLAGTDGYTQGIAANESLIGKFSQQETMQVNGNSALLSVWVPGACSGVNDTINIHSNLLNESQEIKITFGGGGSIADPMNGSCGPSFNHH